MARAKKYIDKDVVTAAKERLHHIFDIFDSVAVSFSGGKDSLVALHLTHEVAEERGLKTVEAFFYDEELIPDVVIETVDYYRQQPWVNLRWFCYPLKSTKFVLGKTANYVQWDPARRWIRPQPPYALVPRGAAEPLSQQEFNAVVGNFYPGKCAFVTGIRASESIIRYRASVNKLNENYINATVTPKVSLCKPLYDWEEDDVLKFIYERKVRYCQLYDAQHLAGGALRVATPFIAESAKQLHRLRAIAPTFYQQVIELFPEMLVQERYWKEYDTGAVIRQFSDGTMTGVRNYIATIEDPKQRELALKRLAGIEKRQRLRPGAYPVDYVLRYFINGGYKRELLPLAKD